ncbi:MAG: pentapeptide repeat-containing protein [Planctomycetota bacterium]
MEPKDEIIREILAGRRPADADLSGVTLDGKRLPKTERKEWDLSGVNLRGVVLTRLDLESACFRGADLAGAAFMGVGLSKADFRDVSAAGAIFEDVNLAYASFRGSDLRGASFSYANLADIDFKGADLRGASVNGVRFSLNGGTHCLGLKEALNHRYREVSYPFAAGVSGDAFWLSYFTEHGRLAWGGFPRETFRRGLVACGYETELVNEFDVEHAWRRLVEELREGRGVITPLHVGGRCITGSGFGGSEWVYVSDYRANEDAVRVRCLLGNDLEFTWDEFVRAWCIHHPMAEYRDEIVYTMCVVGDRVQEVEPWEAVLAGLRSGVEILGLGEFARENAVCGIPAYDMLLRDLEQADPEVGDECCPWLGLGLMHHHGSRWAIRDFLLEARSILPVGAPEIDRALATYESVLADLRSVIELLPGSMADDDEASEQDRDKFLSNRHLAAKHLRSARTAEEDAREALKGVLEAAK